MEQYCCNANFTCTDSPTPFPSAQPSSVPSSFPTAEPSNFPSSVPTGEPTGYYVASVESASEYVSSSEPTGEPTGEPTSHYVASAEPTSHYVASAEPTSVSTDMAHIMIESPVITASPTPAMPDPVNTGHDHHYKYEGAVIGLSIVFSFFIGMYIGIKKKNSRTRRSSAPALPPRLGTRDIRYSSPQSPSPTFANISGESKESP